MEDQRPTPHAPFEASTATDEELIDELLWIDKRLEELPTQPDYLLLRAEDLNQEITKRKIWSSYHIKAFIVLNRQYDNMDKLALINRFLDLHEKCKFIPPNPEEETEKKHLLNQIIELRLLSELQTQEIARLHDRLEDERRRREHESYEEFRTDRFND